MIRAAATVRAAGPDELDGFDLTDLDNFAHGFPHDLCLGVRRHRPEALAVGGVAGHDPTSTPAAAGSRSR